MWSVYLYHGNTLQPVRGGALFDRPDEAVRAARDVYPHARTEDIVPVRVSVPTERCPVCEHFSSMAREPHRPREGCGRCGGTGYV